MSENDDNFDLDESVTYFNEDDDNTITIQAESKQSKKRSKRISKTTQLETGEIIDENESITSINGIGESTAQKLNEIGIRTIIKLALTKPDSISSIKGFSEESAKKFISNAKQSLGWKPIVTGIDMLEKQQNMFVIPTGSSELDKLLGGGIKNESYQFYGQYRSGKTELSLQISVNAMMPKEYGGLGEDTTIIWIATESFPIIRLVQLIQAKPFWKGNENLVYKIGKDEIKISEKQKHLLNNFKVFNCTNSNDQIQARDRIYENIDQYKNIRVIVVDSLTAHFRAEYIGLNDLAPRQKEINQHLHDLKEIATFCNASLICTNQVVTNVNIIGPSLMKAVGGNIVSHGIENIIELKKGKDNNRIAHLEDSQYLPPGEAKFSITPEGISD